MSKFLPVLIAVLIVFLIDWYAFQAIRHSSAQWNITIKRLTYLTYWVLSILAIGSILFLAVYSPFELPQTMRIIWFGAFVILYLPKLLLIPFLLADDAGRLIRYGASLLINGESSKTGTTIKRSEFLIQSGLLISGFLMGGLVYGVLRGGYNYTVRRLSILLPHLPAEFNKLRIVQISDIHSGSFTGTGPLNRAVEMINAEKPDLVFFTGDLVNNTSNEVLPFKSVLEKIRAKIGIYAILGNHDYGDYHAWKHDAEKAANLQQLVNFYAAIGWKLLRNENEVLGKEDQQIAIIGMENWGTRFQKYGNMEKSVEGTKSAAVRLLLSHDPSHWDAEVTKHYSNIDVTFSGHTHGAQMGVEIPGFFKWSPSQYLYKQWAGLYQNGRQYLHVNRGLGFLAYPGRLGISPEITVIELNKA